MKETHLLILEHGLNGEVTAGSLSGVGGTSNHHCLHFPSTLIAQTGAGSGCSSWSTISVRPAASPHQLQQSPTVTPPHTLTLASAILPWCPLYEKPWPIPTPDNPPGQPQCTAPWEHLACAHFSSSHPNRLALVQSVLGLLACTCSSASQPAEANRRMQSVQGMFLHKSTPSRLGKVDVLLINSVKQRKSNKMRRQRIMLQMKEQDKTSEKEQNKQST